MFKSIAENVSAQVVEKKSKFISHLCYVESVEEAENVIKKINQKYFDARHNCYAFCIATKNGRVNRFSDDGEPSGTAGSPMLNILTSQNLSNVLVVVTRYFGGILLGTGGLVRAYTEATMEALKQAKIVNKEYGKEAQLMVNYADLDKMKYFLKHKKINMSSIQYGENVTVTVEITQENWDEILQQRENLNFKIVESKIVGEKFIVV